MATPDDKLVARVLREYADLNDEASKLTGMPWSARVRKRADELDPPKTRVDRIMERIRPKAGTFVSPAEYERFASIRKILEEEGI